jgi:signal transduction histidine kinase
VIHSHKAYIYSIFINLISNSLKYRSESNPIISVDFYAEQEIVKVIITDNGVGIDLERRAEDLFNPYKRFLTPVEGKGLGMFLLKSHIEVLAVRSLLRVSLAQAPLLQFFCL